MDSDQMGIWGLVNGSLGQVFNLFNTARDVNSKKPKLELETQGVRFIRNTRVPIWEKVNLDAGFYEVVEVNLVNRSSREILVRELNIAFHHPIWGRDPIMHPACIERDILLSANARKIIVVEPWIWLTSLYTQTRDGFDDLAAWKNFVASAGELELKIDVAPDPYIELITKSNSFPYNPDSASFFDTGEVSINLESLLLREYRSLKQGLLDDDVIGSINHGVFDEDAHNFAQTAFESLKLKPNISELVKKVKIGQDDPSHRDFLEGHRLFLNLMHYGGSFGTVTVLKNHLSRHVESDIWKEEQIANYFILKLIDNLRFSEISDIDLLHPDFLMSPKTLLKLFGIEQNSDGFRSNFIMSELIESLAESSTGKDRRKTDSFGLPLN